MKGQKHPAMPILADYHMHTPLCKHAAGPMEAYVERAIELGLREIGFSDHNPLPGGRSAEVRMEEAELDYYVERVQELQYRYRGKIEVLLGLELDYLEGLEWYFERQISRYPWDYIIGSVHYLDADCRQSSWPRQYGGDVGALYARYFELVRKLVRSGLCDIIAHLDLPKRTGRAPGEREAAEITRTLELIAQCGLCLEVNTSGYRHAELPVPEPYPGLPVVEQAWRMGIALVVNSDAHAPEQVGLRFDEISGFLWRAGCRQLARFRRRSRQMYEL
jgi:histidinol-phosphatase (PHP family)